MYSAVLYTVLLVAPVIAGKIVERYAVSPMELGRLFSLELAAFSLATLPAYLWLRRLNLRVSSYMFTAIVIAGNVTSGFVESFEALMVTRFVTALAAGSITVILLTLSARTSNPSRAFGIFVVFQLAMGALILAVFPALFANTGVEAIYWTLAGLAALCLFVVRAIDGEALRQPAGIGDRGMITVSAGAKATNGKPPALSFILGLVAVLLFYISLSGVWTFIAQISENAGMDLSASSLVLSVATVAGIASALMATVMGDTPYRRLYLLMGYLGMALSVTLLFGTPGLARFTVAAVIFKFAWTFVLPYLLSALSSLGGGAHTMSTVNLMIGTGFAIGPMLGGALIESAGGFAALLAVAVVGVLASMGCVLAASRKGRNQASTHESLAREAIEVVWSQGDVSRIPDFYAEDFRIHLSKSRPNWTGAPMATEWKGREGLVAVVTAVKAAFPDYTETPEHVVASGDMVAMRMINRGTHTGATIESVTATGRSFEVVDTMFVRIENGLIAEQWSLLDEFSVALQLGILEPGDLRVSVHES